MLNKKTIERLISKSGDVTWAQSWDTTCWLLARYVEEATLRNAAVRIRGKTRIGKQPCSNSDFLRELARKCRANIRVAEAEHRKRFSAGQESQSEEDR